MLKFGIEKMRDLQGCLSIRENDFESLVSRAARTLQVLDIQSIAPLP